MTAIKPVRNHGSIRIRFRHDGKSYQLSTGGRWGDRVDMAFAHAVAARIELDIKAGCFDVTLARYRSGGIIPERANKPKRPGKLLPVWDRWVETLELSADTKADHYEMVRRMIVKSRPPIDAADWFTTAAKDLAPSTSNKRLGYLKRCLEWAMAEGLATMNPYDGLKSRKVVKEPVKPFGVDEVSRIMHGFRELHPTYVPFVGFLLATGARTSEAIGLQWKRVDFARGEITIADSLPKNRSGKGLKRKETKTGSITVLPMNEALRHLLEAQPRGSPDDLVFLSSQGAAIDRYNFRNAWAAVLKSQGVPYQKPYSSRHTTASHAIDQGATLPEVAYMLGHKDSRMVSETYGHLVTRPELPEMPIQ